MSDKAKRRVEASLSAIFILSLVLVAFVLVFTGGSATARQIATLKVLAGQVQVRPGGEEGHLAKDGESLRTGDIVETAPDARAAIEYFEGSVTRLDFDTRVELVSLDLLGLGDESGPSRIEISQTEGNTYNRVVESPDPASRFVVRTPTATASVEGTAYAVLVDDDGSTTIATLEGAVTARAGSEVLDVPAGTMVLIGTDGSMGSLLDIPESLLQSDWFSFNRCTVERLAGCEPEDVDPEEPPAEPTDEPTGGPTEGPPGPRSIPPGEDVDPPPSDDVTPPPGVNRQPDARFTASPGFGPAPLTVHFVDSSSDPDGDPLSRAWDFGDGDSQNFGATPTHTFERRGHYTVRLVVSDPQGASDTRTRVIAVGTRADDDAPVVRITERPENPTRARDAHFRFTSSEAGAGFICTLDGDSRPCGPGDPMAGSGVVGSVDYPNLSTGPHSFRVSMTDASGNTGADSVSWTILPRGSEFDHIVIAPSNSTIDLGRSRDFTAEAFDANGDSLGDVTAHTRFTIQPSGSCEGNTCTPTAAGTHTVVGKYSGDSDSATLEVVDAPAAPQCPAYALSFHTRPPASIAAGHPFNVQVRVEVLGDDPGGALAISLGGAPFSTGETSETWNGNGTVVFNGLKIEQPGSYGLIATAPCARASDPAPVSVTGGPGGGGGAVVASLVVLRAAASRRRRR